MPSDASSNLPKPLPRNRAVLEIMFKHCDLCIHRARNALHRSQQKVLMLFDLDDGKLAFSEMIARVKEIDEAHQRDRDTSLTEIESLWPYCEIDLLSAAGDYMSQGGMAVAGSQSVVDEKTANEFARSGALLFLGQRLHVTALQRLRHRIFEALESKSADTGADIEALLAKLAPRNDDIASLHLKLIREQKPGKSQNQIALDFTKGDRERAASLLRGVRRYRNRLKDSNV
jgi:hypothetical protein